MKEREKYLPLKSARGETLLILAKLRSEGRFGGPRSVEIRAARDAVGFTVREAARLIYCPDGAWKDWETGASRMHPAFWELFRMKTRLLPIDPER